MRFACGIASRALGVGECRKFLREREYNRCTHIATPASPRGSDRRGIVKHVANTDTIERSEGREKILKH